MKLRVPVLDICDRDKKIERRFALQEYVRLNKKEKKSPKTKLKITFPTAIRKNPKNEHLYYFLNISNFSLV